MSFRAASFLRAAAVLALFAGSGPALSASQIGYWTLDEGGGTTAADSSGSGNTGTLVNTPTWTTGKIGNALSFNGTTNSVAVNGAGNLANLYGSGLTAMAWIKPTSVGGGGRGRILDKDNNSVGWFFAMYTTTSLTFTTDQYSTTSPVRNSAASIVLNSWQHVAVTWDGSAAGANIHIYINGVLADGSSSDGSGTPQSDVTTPLTVGNRPVDNARGFTGLIDDARVYSGVLTAAQILAIASDSQAPTAPSAAGATASSSSQIAVTWTASTDNVGVTAYRVERCAGASCSNFVQVASVAGSPFNDSGLTASTSYSYRIRATDAAGLLSAYSNTASATTQASGGDTQPPSAPTNLASTAASSTQINLSWGASSDNVGVTTYRIERCQGTGCSTFTQIATVSGTPPATVYQDTGLTASTSYSYRVRAGDAAGNLSSYSNTSSATTSSAPDTQPPSAPTGLNATAGPLQMTLTWTASTDNVGVTKYWIERCQGAGCSTFAQIGSVTGAPPVTYYVDANLAAEASYSYRVRASDAANNLSSYSNTATGICQDCD